MKSLDQYINKTSSPLKLTPEQKEKLLKLDEEYGELVMMYRKDLNTKDIANLQEECEKFLRARKRGLKYFPYIKLTTDNGFYTDGILPRLKQLLVEFLHFDCFLSKYYIELIEDMIRTVEFTFDIKGKYKWYTTYRAQTPSLENLQLAYDMLRENPYEVIDDSDRTISGKSSLTTR